MLLAVRTSGDVIGETALLEMAPRSATARARGACKLLAIHKTLLDELVQSSASAARIMFFTVLARWRATGVMLRQSEKMAQLGTLTAGVAHELNNPAAAVQRGASQLADALADLLAAERALVEPLATASFALTIDALQNSRPRERRPPVDLDALTRGDREEQVEAWLDGRQVADAVELAPTLVTLDYDVESWTGWPPTSAPPTCRPSRAGSRPRTWSGTASPRSRRAPGASPRSSRRSRATPISIRRPCRRSTFTRGSTARW